MKFKIPKLNIYQIVLLALAALLMLACIVVTLIYFPSLPDMIPKHIGIDGSYNRYGGKASAFSIPVVCFVMNAIFVFIIFSPKLLENPNTVRKLDPRMKPLIARETLGMLSECAFLCTALFDYMQAFILAQKPVNLLGVWIILGIILVSSIYHSIRLSKYGLK